MSGPEAERELDTKREQQREKREDASMLAACGATQFAIGRLIRTEVSVADATAIWQLAQKRELQILKECGPQPDAVAEKPLMLQVSVDGEVELNLQLQPQFAASKDSVTPDVAALNAKGEEIFAEKLTLHLGTSVVVDRGVVFRKLKGSESYERIGWFPIGEKAPDRSAHFEVRSVEDLVAARQSIPKGDNKRKDLVFRPTIDEARSPAELHRILKDGLAFMAAYLETVSQQIAGPHKCIRDKLIIRPPIDKINRVKARGFDKKVEGSELRRCFLGPSDAGSWPVTMCAVRVGTLWEQALRGRLAKAEVGAVPFRISESKPLFKFSALGELRIELTLNKEWGEPLKGDNLIEFSDHLKRLAPKDAKYALRHGVVYREVSQGPDDFEALMVAPRIEERWKPIKPTKERLLDSESEEEPDKPSVERVSNNKLVLKSGSKRIDSAEAFERSLQELLNIGSAYLSAKAGEVSGGPYREGIVIKPLPEEASDRPRSMFTIFSLFDAHDESREHNQLLSAIEAQEHPNTTFDDIKGQSHLVESLKLFVSQLNNPGHFAKFGSRPPDGILLSGPPGNGKSSGAAAVASALGSGFINISFKELLKFEGNMEKLIKSVVKIAEEWADYHPSRRTVVFLDEIDVHLRSNEKFDALLRTHLSGLEKTGKLILIAATNNPDVMSSGLRERFTLQLEVGNPDEAGIVDVLTYHFLKAAEGGVSRLGTSVDLRTLAKDLSGYSARRLKDIVNQSLTLLAARVSDTLADHTVSEDDIMAATKTIKREAVSDMVEGK